MSRADPAPPPGAYEVMLVPIREIYARARHRKDMGDLQGLADSITEVGTLLQPILITTERQLVCGERRLRACRDILGWTEIPARVFDIERIVDAEYVENEWRKDLTPSERIAILATMKRKPEGRLSKTSADRPSFDTAAKSMGFASRRVAKRAAAVVRNGVDGLVAAMDGKRISIDAAAILAKEKPEVQERIIALPEAARKQQVRQIEAQQRKKAPPEPPKRTITIPWNPAPAAAALVRAWPPALVRELVSELEKRLAAVSAAKPAVSRHAKEGRPERNAPTPRNRRERPKNANGCAKSSAPPRRPRRQRSEPGRKRQATAQCIDRKRRRQLRKFRSCFYRSTKMGRFEIPHLVEKPAPSRGMPRYYWEPSRALRRLGFCTQRVPKDRRAIVDERTLRAAAIAEAAQLNRFAEQKLAVAALDQEGSDQPRPPVISPPHTIDELIRRYVSSEFYAGLQASTKRGYDQCLEQISKWAGTAPVMVIDWERISKLAASMTSTPSYRNHVLRILRLLLNYAVRIGWLLTNPCLRPPLAPIERSGLVWPREAVDAFVATADAMGNWSVGTAVVVNEWLGQRQGDVLRLTRGLLRDGVLLIRQGKTGAQLALPYGRVPHVRERLEHELARIDAQPWRIRPLELIVDESQGRRYTADRFRSVFGRVRAATAGSHPIFHTDFIQPGRAMDHPDALRLEMTSLTFQHLRHTAVTRLAEAGCDGH